MQVNLVSFARHRLAIIIVIRRGAAHIMCPTAASHFPIMITSLTFSLRLVILLTPRYLSANQDTSCMGTIISQQLPIIIRGDCRRSFIQLLLLSQPHCRPSLASTPRLGNARVRLGLNWMLHLSVCTPYRLIALILVAAILSENVRPELNHVLLVIVVLR